MWQFNKLSKKLIICAKMFNMLNTLAYGLEMLKNKKTTNSNNPENANLTWHYDLNNLKIWL